MSDIFSFLKNIFSGGTGKAQPFTHELLKRSEKELEDYRQWKDSHHLTDLTGLLRSHFLETDSELDSSNAGFIKVSSPATSGIFIKYNRLVMDKAHFRNFFDLSRERILGMGYRNYTSDVKNYLRNDRVETLERHYLKPALKLLEEDQKVDQRYGNVTIEHFLIDGEPVHIKLFAHIYSDRNYTNPLDFEKLLRQLLN